MYGARMQSTQKLVCELTVRAGKVVYDLNGVSRPDWETLPKDYLNTGDPRWDSFTPQRRTAPAPARK
jgi:dihydroorotase